MARRRKVSCQPLPDREHVWGLVERFRGDDIPDRNLALKEIEAAIGDEARCETTAYRLARCADQPLETLVDWVMQAIRERGGQ